MNWSEFRQLMSEHFDIEELRILCFDLDIDYENLPGDRKDRKVAELIKYLRTHQRIPELVNALNNMRPPIHWENILEVWDGDKRAYSFIKGKASHATARQSAGNNRLKSIILGSIIILIASTGLVLRYSSRGYQSLSGFLAETPPPAIVLIETPTATVVPASTLTAISTSTTVQTQTATPSNTPTPTSLSTETSLPTETPTLVAPVAADEYMILVAQFENIGDGADRDIARFIVDDLQQQFEVRFSNSRIRIRELEAEIVTSKRKGLEIANRFEANIIVWGNYDENGVSVEAQIGSFARLPHSFFSRDDFAKVTGPRITLSNERNESVARPLLGMLIMQISGTNDTVEVTRLGSMADDLPLLESSKIIGNGMSANVGRAWSLYYANPKEALSEIDGALSIEQHPLLYSFRALVNSYHGEYSRAIIDNQTAMRLAPDGWIFPHSSVGFISLVEKKSVLALENAVAIIEAEPEGWFGHYAQGIAYYLEGEYPKSLESFLASIDRDPIFNWPYTFAITIALRQGDIETVREFSPVLLRDFPDPTAGVKAMSFVFGEGSVVGHTLGASGYTILGQYEKALKDAEAVLAIDDSFADMYLLAGFAHCNLGDYEGAEAAYIEGLKQDPNYTLLYLLRAEAHQRQGDILAAFSDAQTVTNAPDGAAFAELVAAATIGDLSCETFFDE